MHALHVTRATTSSLLSAIDGVSLCLFGSGAWTTRCARVVFYGPCPKPFGPSFLCIGFSSLALEYKPDVVFFTKRVLPMWAVRRPWSPEPGSMVAWRFSLDERSTNDYRETRRVVCH